MGINDSFADANDGLADATDWVIDASGTGTGAVVITELGGNNNAEIYREHDPDGDTTWEVRVQIDTPTGTWHSQGNDLLVSTGENVRLIVRNISGTTADFFVSGYEVDN